MPNKQIFTENPENDLWQELMQFSYKANVYDNWFFFTSE